MSERLVAHFDILGFKNFVVENPINVVVEKFTSIFNSLYSAMVRDSYRKGSSPEEMKRIYHYDVPFKDSNRKCIIVNWASAWNAGGPVRDDFFSNVMTGEEQIDRKYRNTLDYLQNWAKLA